MMNLHYIIKKGYLWFSSAEFADLNVKMFSIHRKDFLQSFCDGRSHLFDSSARKSFGFSACFGMSPL